MRLETCLSNEQTGDGSCSYPGISLPIRFQQVITAFLFFPPFLPFLPPSFLFSLFLPFSFQFGSVPERNNYIVTSFREC